MPPQESGGVLLWQMMKMVEKANMLNMVILQPKPTNND